MKSLKFQHFKGNRYTVLCEAKHSETEEDLVVYKKEGDEKIWVRPKRMFEGTVKVNGQSVPRFAPICE